MKPFGFIMTMSPCVFLKYLHNPNDESKGNFTLNSILVH